MAKIFLKLPKGPNSAELRTFSETIGIWVQVIIDERVCVYLIVTKISREIGIIQLEYLQISDTDKEKRVKCKVVYTISGEDKEYFVVIDKLIEVPGIWRLLFLNETSNTLELREGRKEEHRNYCIELLSLLSYH